MKRQLALGVSALALCLASTAFAADEAPIATSGEVEALIIYGQGQSRQVQTVDEAQMAQAVAGVSPLKVVDLLPGVTFQVATAKKRTIRGELQNIRRFVGITTSGSPWWWLRVIGDPGRSLLMKGLRPLYARGCRMSWLQLHDMNHATAADREAFLAKVDRSLRLLT
jgi:hypothetical protein